MMGRTTYHSVMAGFVPAIHALLRQDVDARHKFTTGPAFGRTRLAGHDVERTGL
jgi:hypothetical protein